MSFVLTGLLALSLSASTTTAGCAPAAEAIRAHTAFLAHDLLEGREAGTRGYDIAAAYVAAQFQALGLASPDGSIDHLQKVRLQRRTLVAQGARFTLLRDGRAEAFENGRDIAVDASARSSEETLEAPLVFAGYGISAPSLGRDDFRDLDVRGKIVVILEGAPASIPGSLRAHYSWIQQKERMAAAAGAVGLLTLKSPAREKVSPFERTRRLRPLPQLTWVDESGAPASDGVIATVSLGPAAASAVFAGARRDLAAIYAEADGGGWPSGFDLPGRVRLERASQHDTTTSANVVGSIPGSDPRLRREYIVVTAHLDHVGRGASVDGDDIYNGAADNAGGVAVLLETARTLLCARPKRSVLFVATTAEEKGLVGADYFVRHPPVTLSRMAANLNLDGLMTFHDFSDIVAYGAEHSSLGEAAARAASSVEATLTADPDPERGNFALSDQYPFARAGVPALFPQPGPGPARDGGQSGRDAATWFSRHYHQPSDEADLAFRWDVAARWATFAHALALDIANAAERPRWTSGDPAAEVFAQGSGRSEPP